MTSPQWLWPYVVIAGLVVTASAQTPQPTFEVASVKLAAPGIPGGRVQFLPGGRFVGENVPFDFLLQQVYGVAPFQIVIDQKWRSVVANSRYQIEARAADPSASPEQLREMAKALLADRFNLKLRTERREIRVYALTAASGGVKGARAADGKGGGVASMLRGWLRGRGVTTERLAQTLTAFVDRPVVNRTTTDQVLDFDLTWTPTDVAAAAAGPSDPGCPSSFREMAAKLGERADMTCPSIFTAVEEQLGIKLNAQNAPFDVLVIDSVQPPTEN
jgi:bla regulator protein blaR1